MESYGLGHLVPFAHEDFETWTKSLQLGLRTYFEEENLLIGGGLDDVWHDRFRDEIFIVDYKSTAGRRNEDKTALEPDFVSEYIDHIVPDIILSVFLMARQ